MTLPNKEQVLFSDLRIASIIIAAVMDKREAGMMDDEDLQTHLSMALITINYALERMKQLLEKDV